MQIRHVKLLKYGSVNTTNEERKPVTTSLTGHFNYPESIEFVDQSDSFIGATGLKFGIEYFLEGFDETAKYSDVVFSCKIVHPPLTNPDTLETSTETIERKYNYLNQKNFDYYAFEFDWEIQPGIWTFQIAEGTTILLEKGFEIKKYAD